MGCHLYCRLFSSNRGLQSLEANSISPPPVWQPKLSPDIAFVSWRAKSPLVENHCPWPSLEVWIWMGVCVLSHFRHVWLFATLWTVAHQAPLSVGFSRQEYCSRLLCLPPGDAPDSSPTSPTLEGRFFTTCATWEAPLNMDAAAKSLQLCPTLCDPRDGSPPGSPVPGILQARTLEWVWIWIVLSKCLWKKKRSLAYVLLNLNSSGMYD